MMNTRDRLALALDIDDPEHPREVSRLGLGDDELPHWMAIDPSGTANERFCLR